MSNPQKDDEKTLAHRDTKADATDSRTAGTIKPVPIADRKMFCDCGKAEYWCTRGCLLEAS